MSEQYGKEPTQEERLRLWDQTLEQYRGLTDSLGQPIDPEVLEPIVGLNLLGATTQTSCGGHIEKGLIAPRIIVAADREPWAQYEGEQVLLDALSAPDADTYAQLISRAKKAEQEGKTAIADRLFERVQAIRIAAHDQLWRQAADRGETELRETAAHRSWRWRNDQVQAQAASLVAAFNAQHPDLACSLELRNGAVTIAGVRQGRIESLSATELQDRNERLPQYQETLLSFGMFLKRRVTGLESTGEA